MFNQICKTKTIEQRYKEKKMKKFAMLNKVFKATKKTQGKKFTA